MSKMKIKTKFNLHDIVYFKENGVVYRGEVTGISTYKYERDEKLTIYIQIRHESVTHRSDYTTMKQEECYKSFKEIERTFKYGGK